MKAYLGLGGNLGQPAENIARALHLLEEKNLGRVVKVSSLYWTEPVGGREQPWFVNAAAEIETALAPEAFHAGLKEIEAELGRTPEQSKDDPRPIDLDLLLWEDAVIQTANLHVPHPRMHLRRFVLVPLAEIAPHALHPQLKRSAAELLASLVDPSRVEKLEPHKGETNR